jgi:hypothetical protein
VVERGGDAAPVERVDGGRQAVPEAGLSGNVAGHEEDVAGHEEDGGVDVRRKTRRVARFPAT